MATSGATMFEPRTGRQIVPGDPVLRAIFVRLIVLIAVLFITYLYVQDSPPTIHVRHCDVTIEGRTRSLPCSR
jgi:hypothetical protein